MVVPASVVVEELEEVEELTLIDDEELLWEIELELLLEELDEE